VGYDKAMLRDKAMIKPEKARKRDSNAAWGSLTPVKAIHKVCVDCVGSPFEFKDCQGDKLYDGPCLLYPYRMGKGRPSVKLIRKYCLYCMGGSPKLVKNCRSISTCPLYLYRMGRNPKRMGLKRGFSIENQSRALRQGNSIQGKKPVSLAIER
jgi:hypothetical protein